MAIDRMPWIKWWVGSSSDMKLRMVAEDCKLPVACIIGAWAYVLEQASKAEPRGSIEGLDYELMAYTLQIPDCETVCNAMKRRKLLHEDGTVAAWDERQGKRERNESSGSSTERVRRYREKQKAQQNSGLGDPGNGGNGETHVTPGNATKRPKKEKEKENKKESKPKPTSSSGDDGEGDVKPFDQFWNAYPRRVGKQDAQKAWTKIKPDSALLAIILHAIEKQKDGADWRKDDGQFIPHPATWLRAGRWLDEVRPYVAPPLKLPAGWWETKDGMEAAGMMLTPPLKPRPGEFPKDFAQRIRQAIGQVDPDPLKGYVAPAIPEKIERPYMPPTVPEGVQLTEEQREARREEMRENLAKLKQAGNLALAGVAANAKSA